MNHLILATEVGVVTRSPVVGCPAAALGLPLTGAAGRYLEELLCPSRALQESEEGENDSYKYGISAMQGWRTDMVGCRVQQQLDVATAQRLAVVTRLWPIRRPIRRSLMACSPSAAQEDAHAAVLQLEEGKPGSKSALFAVLDGHGGAEVARFVANHLVRPGRF